jgi:hypothetical protein
MSDTIAKPHGAHVQRVNLRSGSRQITLSNH